MSRENKLKRMLGELKYQQEKMIMTIKLIDKYIDRIEENTAEVKVADVAIEEEYRNKDLVREIEELLKDIKGDKYGEN